MVKGMGSRVSGSLTPAMLLLVVQTTCADLAVPVPFLPVEVACLAVVRNPGSGLSERSYVQCLPRPRRNGDDSEKLGSPQLGDLLRLSGWAQ